MPNTIRSLDTTVQKIIFHNQKTGYTVFKGSVLQFMPRKKIFRETKESHVFTGYFFCIFPGDHFVLNVEEIFDVRYGSEYLVHTSKRIEPASEIEIRKFLQSMLKSKKMIKKSHIAPLVDQIMKQYGLDAIHQIRQDAHAYDFLKIDSNIINEIRLQLIENESFEDTMIFLQLHQIDCRLAMELHLKYRDGAAKILEDNPYLAYMDEIFDFKTADKLYLTLENPADSEKRCLYTVLAAIRMDAMYNGNLFTREDKLKEKMMNLLTETYKTKDTGLFPFSDEKIKQSVQRLIDDNIIVSDDSFGISGLYLKNLYHDETSIASCLQGFINAPKRITYYPIHINTFLDSYEQTSGITLNAEQRTAVITALTSPVTIISGGPGVGKTQTIKAIIAAIRYLTPDASIRACAPTGKAAVRIQDMANINAATVHRALNIGMFTKELKGGELNCDFMFIDEFSMADAPLCAKLFDAVNSSGRIILVGDYNQLPSVGPGLILRDFISSGRIHKVILKQVFRQSEDSHIITNANRIMNQIPNQPIKLYASKHLDKDFVFIQESNPNEILKKLENVLDDLINKYHYSMDSIQIVSPVRSGNLGTDILNITLQNKFNPNGQSILTEDQEFREGDKVIHIKNNYELDVFNGEVGIISDMKYLNDQTLQVTYPDKSIWYPAKNLKQLDLAYALTVHKTQGSEYPVIIMPVHEIQGAALSKNLIYTALTRAKEKVILIGSKQALSDGLRRETIIERESKLKDRMISVLPKV